MTTNNMQTEPPPTDTTTGISKQVGVALDPELVHSILLVGPTKLDTLQTKSPNLTFEQFREMITRGNDPGFVMKKAFLNHVKDSIILKHDWHPLLNLLLELHTSIRSLVPNRPDLHSKLQDPSFDDASNTDFRWDDYVIRAARALEQLESEVRSQPTLDWISQVEPSPSNNSQDPSFLILSILYFIDKAQLCEKEKQDFYLVKVVAPRLISSGEGLALERNDFRTKFTSSPPTTQKWTSELMACLEQKSCDRLESSAKERQLFVITGWIESILFETQQPQLLPEIFALDLEALRSIRKSTRAAAAGCSLGWHACQAANHSSTDALLQDELQGATLVQTMNNVDRYSSLEEYEQSVADCLIGLAQTWNGGTPLQPSVIERLRGQTSSVLRGKDPVLKLLDERMKKVFVRLVKVFVDGTAPVSMHTGLGSSASAATPGHYSTSVFVNYARLEICKSGLAFYALDLALAAEQTIKIGDLAYKLYADEFLDEMVLNAAKSRTSSDS
jgi:hypothetical protein